MNYLHTHQGDLVDISIVTITEQYVRNNSFAHYDNNESTHIHKYTTTHSDHIVNIGARIAPNKFQAHCPTSGSARYLNGKIRSLLTTQTFFGVFGARCKYMQFHGGGIRHHDMFVF